MTRYATKAAAATASSTAWRGTAPSVLVGSVVGARVGSGVVGARVGRDVYLSYLCCVCGHFVRVVRALRQLRRGLEYYREALIGATRRLAHTARRKSLCFGSNAREQKEEARQRARS